MKQAAKRVISDLMCNRPVGQLIGMITRNRIRSRGCILHTDDVAVAPVNKARIFWGLYESAEYRFVRDYLRPDLKTIELGSGIGVISSTIARRLVARTELICVEANPGLKR